MPFLRWSLPGRALVFLLAATSIWCLLAEFYGLCSMRLFTFAILAPATIGLVGIAIVDRNRGDRELWRAVLIGGVSGLLAAFAYDLFRVPFVVASVDQVGPDWLRLPLFKVFPRFGAMILGQSIDPGLSDSQCSLTAHLIGWVYHFSNGVTFGVMYMALIGNANKRSWWWAVALAVGLEMAMLLTPYTTFFGIRLTTQFVIVTFMAHTIFGVVLGLVAKWLANRPQLSVA